jgi:hypothetical protein
MNIRAIKKIQSPIIYYASERKLELTELLTNMRVGMVVIIDAKEAAEATPNILVTHRIHNSKSADLRGEEVQEANKTDSETTYKMEKDEEDDFEAEGDGIEVQQRKNGQET